ncbi:MAG: RluA family pseudouridine synthase [Eubacteriales bacterium]|nr:RluA family pseudouridine synthase [Eubacteriales bacterium]
MTIPILYSDRDLAVCVKPRGVSSEQGGLPELLATQLGDECVRCVHRLDAAVGGVMVYALSSRAAAGLSRQIAQREMRKEYLAVVPGRPEPDEAVLRDLLFHDRAKNKSYVVRRMRAGVREAELSYRVLETAGALSLLSVSLHTGRSHQIRVQFAARGLPLLGDVKYGSAFRDCPIALWSHTLAFRHPADGRALCFSALPERAFPWDSFELMRKEELPCDTSK